MTNLNSPNEQKSKEKMRLKHKPKSEEKKNKVTNVTWHRNVTGRLIGDCFSSDKHVKGQLIARTQETKKKKETKKCSVDI